MNLSKSDFESLGMDEVIEKAKKLWVDPDYSREQDYKRSVVRALEDTKYYISRYFHQQP